MEWRLPFSSLDVDLFSSKNPELTFIPSPSEVPLQTMIVVAAAAVVGHGNKNYGRRKFYSLAVVLAVES